MKSWFNLKEISNKNISLYEGLLLALSFVLVIPYFILSYFDNPSIDDFSFAIKTIELGYWNAQASAYTIWNGRYFASFILCAHPLVIDSYLLYKVIPIILLTLTVHSFYYFISNCFGLKSKIACFILAIAITFWYLDKMPTLVQGIYWASSAITYHLANILMLYLIAIIYLIVLKPGNDTKLRKIACALLIIAGCGSNETTMLVIILLLAGVLTYYLVMERTINKLFLLYFLISVVCFWVLLSSPGGVIREKDYTDPNAKNVFFTIISSFSTGNKYLVNWILAPQTAVISTLLILSYFTWSNSFKKTKETIIYSLLALVVGYLLIIATFSPGFWATARVAPDRALNCSYWLFVIVWAILLFFITSFSFLSLKKMNCYPVILLSAVMLLITTKTSGNYHNACNDIISGKAYIYNKECKKRVEIMRKCSDTVMCEVPAFSAYPKSVFNEDLVEDDFNWWNREYAKYYHRKAVRVIHKNSSHSHKYFLTFDDAESKTLSNAASITNELFFSPPNSSLLPGKETYSASFGKLINDMDITNPVEISKVNINARVYSQDSVIDAVLVFAITDPAGKNVFWFGKEIVRPDYPAGKWIEEADNITITQSSVMESQNKISVYLWNRGKGKVYVDDLSVNIY